MAKDLINSEKAYNLLKEWETKWTSWLLDSGSDAESKQNPVLIESKIKPAKYSYITKYLRLITNIYRELWNETKTPKKQ